MRKLIIIIIITIVVVVVVVVVVEVIIIIIIIIIIKREKLGVDRQDRSHTCSRLSPTRRRPSRCAG